MKIRRLWRVVVAIIAIAIVWQLLVVALEVGDSWDLAIEFAVFIVETAFIFIVGGSVGVALAVFIGRNAWWVSATSRFLRVGLWIPFLASWALQLGWMVGIVTVIACACYSYLAARFILHLEWLDARRHVLRYITLQALFISLLSQIWNEYGLKWFLVTEHGGVLRGSVTLLLILTILFIVDRMFQFGFQESVVLSRAVFLRETSEENRKSLLGVLVLMGTSIASWQLLSMYGLHSTLSAPLDAFKIAYRLLLGDGIPPPLDNVLWGDIGVSLAEIFGGLVLGGGVALVVYKSSFAGNFWRKCLVLVLPLTYIAPIMISPFLLGWGILTGASQTTIGVALLSFFPFIQVLWGLSDYPLACRILAAADEALPPAFVAMLFGETMHAFSGLGFFMLTARDYTHRATEAVATLLIIIALLIGLSAIFRTIIKRLYQEPLHP